MLGWNPDDDARHLYLEAALVWIHSLRESGTDADIIVLVNYDDPEMQETLEKAGAIVKRVDNLDRAWGGDEYFEPWFANVALAKLRAFQLTEYERVQFMDVDVSIDQRTNPDQLFLRWPNAKLVTEGLGGDSPLRAGWLMIRPSDADFEQLERIARDGKFDDKLGWDHLDLPVEYPGWEHGKGALNKWGFFGSQLEQGEEGNRFIYFEGAISHQDSHLPCLHCS